MFTLMGVKPRGIPYGFGFPWRGAPGPLKTWKRYVKDPSGVMNPTSPGVIPRSCSVPMGSELGSGTHKGWPSTCGMSCSAYS